MAKRTYRVTVQIEIHGALLSDEDFEETTKYIDDPEGLASDLEAFFDNAMITATSVRVEAGP
jgi:hypothetical protein